MPDSFSEAVSRAMLIGDQNLILLFAPWAFGVAIAHVAKRDFRAHLRRRHPRAYAGIYGVPADRTRYSALDPRAWLLAFRFELSDACRAFGDRRLNMLGRRLRRRVLCAIVLYGVAIGATVDLAQRAADVIPVQQSASAVLQR